ncbi:MAG: type II and III secretion system protein [Candidatus Brocadiia bacterium]
MLFVLLAMAAGAASAAESGQEVPLAGLCEEACRDVYQAALRHATLELGYAPAEEEFPGLPEDLGRYSCLVRAVEGGQARRVVLGLESYAMREPSLYLTAQAGGEEAAADLEAIAQAADQAVKDIQESPRKFRFSELVHETYQLSCIDMESAVEILGQLGYNTDPPGGEVDLSQLPVIFPMPTKGTDSVVSSQASKQKLNDQTLSAPQDRLMIVYHLSQCTEAGELQQLLDTTIDVQERQVLIEGLLIELTEDNFRELGTEFELFGNEFQWSSFAKPDGWVRGDPIPFVLYHNPEGLATPADLAERLRYTIRMIIQQGQGEILSSPSVLVLNNQNAQIQVVRDVPIVETLVRENTTNFKVRYETVGIVLNIRPRVSQDDRSVALQILVEVSEAPEEDFIVIEDQNIAPLINRRIVQTVARVQDNTPFIIGGLIRNEEARTVDRVPVLSRIPILGQLFQRRTNRREKREVIIVLTPRVISSRGTQRAVLPKDSERFDFLDNRLFRNSYRLKAEDVFDLGFLETSQTIRRTMARVRRFVMGNPQYAGRSPFAEMASGVIPGEDAVVIRMLFEIARDKLALHERIPTENMLFFLMDSDKPAGFDVRFIARKGYGVLEQASPDGTLKGYFNQPYPKDVLLLKFRQDPTGGLEEALRAPVAEMEWVTVQDEDDDAVERRLHELNAIGEDYVPDSFALAIEDPDGLVRLKNSIALREIAAVNNFERLLALQRFRVGRRIVVPEFGSEQERMFLIDHNVAENFYKSDYYYAALKQRLEKAYEIVDRTLPEELP